AVGDTAYIVGGYTGTKWLDTIVAWKPGGRAHVVARLPMPVRYAAVAAAGGRVVIAGGSLPSGTASRDVYSFDPRSGAVRRIGVLPAATTHAAAAALDRGPGLECLRRRRGRDAHRRRPAREAAGLRPEQRLEHGRRDRSAHVQGRPPLRRRRVAPTRRPVVGSEDALRHQRHRQQPD